MTKVYKFGGASIKDALSIKNMSQILHRNQSRHLLVVISAMGKTTNLLETILFSARNENEDFSTLFQQLIDFHINICNDLFPDKQNPVFEKLQNTFEPLKLSFLNKNYFGSYDEHYDACIGFGELLSTAIVDAFLLYDGHDFQLIDARDYIITDEHFRHANVDWKTTESNILVLNTKILKNSNVLTQGFIGSSKNNKTTTLGREGSDYSAAIFGSCLHSDEVVIWKDVPGMLNADPKRFQNTKKLDTISYSEAIELAYYGATIIHPNTIKPLQNKNIPLKVKSFLQPDLPASMICENHETDSQTPSFIIKDDQVLISISPRDFSFMDETNLYLIFKVLAEIKMSVNVLQTSAISVSVCSDFDAYKLELLKDKLNRDFTIRYNDKLSLLTIRHYKDDQIPDFFANRTILLEQRSRVTLQLVIQ